jgi:hypothetical protein
VIKISQKKKNEQNRIAQFNVINEKLCSPKLCKCYFIEVEVELPNDGSVRMFETIALIKKLQVLYILTECAARKQGMGERKVLT